MSRDLLRTKGFWKGVFLHGTGQGDGQNQPCSGRGIDDAIIFIQKKHMAAMFGAGFLRKLQIGKNSCYGDSYIKRTGVRQPAYPGKVAFHENGDVADVVSKRTGSPVLLRKRNWPIKLPIADLINGRMVDLGLDRERLGFRLGYTNPTKAAGRVQALCDGFVDNRKGLRALHRLPAALEVKPEDVGKAVIATRAVLAERERYRLERIRQEEQEEEVEYRASFEPHGFLYTRDTRPSNFTMFALSGGEDRWLKIPIDTTRPPVTYAVQALEVLPGIAKAGEDGNYYAPFFGRVHGFYVNFSVDWAVRYDLNGNPVEVLDHSYRIGRGMVRIGA